MKNLLKYILFGFTVVIILESTLFAQVKSIGFGGNIGIGSIESNSPSLSSFSGGLILNVEPEFNEDISFRISFTYLRKIEYFVPENRTNKYYPFLKVFTLKTYINQRLSDYFFVEEGFGIAIVNDRVFSDRENWDYGAAVNFFAGIDLQRESSKGFITGIGLEYGKTFTNFNPGYFLVYLEIRYHWIL
jgi:hypothetical protein